MKDHNDSQAQNTTRKKSEEPGTDAGTVGAIVKVDQVEVEDGPGTSMQYASVRSSELQAVLNDRDGS